MFYYKYRSPINLSKPDECNTGRIFLNSELYFARISKFNDPFEGRIELDTSQSKGEAIDRHFRVIRTRNRAKNTCINPVSSDWYNAKENVERIYERVITGNYIDHNGYYEDVMDEYHS